MTKHQTSTNTIQTADGLAIRVQALEKWYGHARVLQGVELEVKCGEKIVICGPSGSGKSTLIRCINGLEAHQKGQIIVNGHTLTDDPKIKALVRRDAGMVFQHFNLYPHLTVLQNCTLSPMQVLKMPRKDAEARARDYLKKVRLSEHEQKFPVQLSGGQQQRVAIARALCMRPKVMLFDEPTSALDPELVREVLDTIRELAREGMTMICVTHEMSFARAVADRVVFMDEGKILTVAPPAEFFGSSLNPRLRAFLSQVAHPMDQQSTIAG